jgi:tetratricopeptide (TPR) repeat protein
MKNCRMPLRFVKSPIGPKRVSTLRYFVRPRLVLFLVSLVNCAGLTLAQEAHSPTPESQLADANVLLKQGKPRDALVLLTSIAGKNQGPAFEAVLGTAYFETRQFPQAIEHLQAVLREKPDDLESMHLLGLSFYQERNYREALPLLEKLGPHFAKQDAESGDVLSTCYLMTQRLDKARNVLAETFSVPPESAMAYLAFAKLLVRHRMVEAAVPELEEAVQLDPRILMAHFLLGEIDLYQSKPQAAVVEFQREMLVNPTLWLVYWRLGDAYTRLGNYDEAEKVLKESIWLNDGSAAALILLGEIALKKNDPALGVGFLQRGLDLDPENAEAHEQLANAYKALGRAADADQQIEITKKLRTQFPSTQNENGLLQTVP